MRLMIEAEDGKAADRGVPKTININLVMGIGSAIGTGSAVLSLLFIQWGHEATGLPKWVIAPFAMASAFIPAWHLIKQLLYGSKKA